MYGIFTYIWLIFMVHVARYIIAYMDAMDSMHPNKEPRKTTISLWPGDVTGARGSKGSCQATQSSQSQGCGEDQRDRRMDTAGWRWFPWMSCDGRKDQWWTVQWVSCNLLLNGVLLGLYSYNPVILTFDPNLQRDIQVVGKFSEMQVVYERLHVLKCFKDGLEFSRRNWGRGSNGLTRFDMYFFQFLDGLKPTTTMSPQNHEKSRFSPLKNQVIYH